MSEQPPSASTRPGLPGGVLALLFTDIEGSTALLHALGEAYPAQLEAHRRILRAAFAAHEGIEVDTEGDSFFAVFRSVKNAVAAVVQAQRELYDFDWPSGHPLRVRMGLHCGEPTPTDEGYVGVDLHRCARLMSAGHGGQVLLSGAAAALVGDLLPGSELRDMGEYRLKDLPRPEHIFGLCIDGLPTEFPPLRTIDNRPHNLPAHLSPLLGRASEVETVRALLQSGARLTTLLGPGGTGKTRLALEIAALTLEMWEDGVFFVPLAPVPPPDATLLSRAMEDAIAGAVARELGLRDDGSQGVQERLLAYLKARKMLLVLDNFEHLIGGAAIVARWMASCPQIQILTTSRVPLHLGGEQEIPVSPLALPRRKPLPSVAMLSQYGAVALFIERARAVKPEFAVNEQNAPAIAEICVRLDGLPLAIELAAARVKLLPPATMLARLGKSLSFLVGGPRDAAARQQTLRAAIAWSHDLLADDEKRLFRRLGVFRGGFGFESAERVCAEPLEDSETPLDVFEGVSSLLNQSLLVYREEVDGQARFGMLETIREFAMEELDAAGEGEVLRERHLEWCFEDAGERDIEMLQDLRHTLLLFEAEADNWRAAWNWSIGARPDAALRLAAASTLLWNRIGCTTEQYERLDASLRAVPEGDAFYRCRALHFLIQADRNGHNWPQYEARLKQLEVLSQEAQLPEFQAIAVDQRMWDEVGVGNIEVALKYSISMVELRQLALDQAQERGLELHEIERCRNELNDAMILQVEIFTKAGLIDEAWALMEQSLTMKRASSDETGLIWALYKYAQLLADTGRVAESRPIFEEVIQRAEQSGDRSVVLGWYRHDAALMALHEGDLARGRELIISSYTVFIENGAKHLMLHILAYLHGLEGNWPLVARTLGAADVARGTPYPDDWRDILEVQERGARAALGDNEFEAQRATGARLDLQRATNEAMPRE
ncbi:putative HTH-type transcriptional regulator [Abditibacteriota bacterium]|nr:putative HTH-type transcriptional regulator [Abditibacteriota bacterium]